MLKSVLERNSPALVALSGGVDSSTLLAYAMRENIAVAAATAVTEFAKPEEIDRAKNLAERLGVPWYPVKISLLENAELRRNPANRCYICKKIIMGKLTETAPLVGCDYVLDGSHADDLCEDRPGRDALIELGVISPFQLAGLGKADIRGLADELGVENTPASSCLATRIPYNEEITLSKLALVENAEKIMREAGIKGILRVRITFKNATIEVIEDEIDLAEENKNRLKPLGLQIIRVNEYKHGGNK
ncbi:MAG: ATP-dependent sacrificial sulfur transferase LarE [Methanocorpusculum sp.]|nr:ATP-dependent sacrificial sulfur transferase LarE [Methanocorpusculum sp.]